MTKKKVVRPKTTNKKVGKKKTSTKKKATKKKVAKNTATSKRKQSLAKKKAAKKGGKASLGKSNADPDQKPLPGFEQIRLPTIETTIKKIVEKKSQRSRLKEDVDDLLSKIPGLFKKHKLNSYTCLGKTVIVEPGSDVVKIKKAKEQ